MDGGERGVGGFGGVSDAHGRSRLACVPSTAFLKIAAVSDAPNVQARPSMEVAALEQYLHEQIPLSAAMKVAVDRAGLESVVLAAPLEPNVNHKNTAFGGSLSTLGILAAWSLVHIRLLREDLRCEVVIQSNHMDYDRPVTGVFTARSGLASATSWPLFIKTLRRRKLARIEVLSELTSNQSVVGRLNGRFVAFLQDS